MQFRTPGLLLLGAMALPASGTAQTAPPAIARTVIAAAKLPTATDMPVHAIQQQHQPLAPRELRAPV